MPKTKTKTDKEETKATKTQYTHRAVTDNKAGHDPKPFKAAWSDQYQICEICGRQVIEKTS